jgi:PAS domain S-box-containing protein
MNLKDVPIKQKLRAVILLTSSVALLLTAAAFIIYEAANFRRATLHNSRTLAQITAANSTAALSFGDDKAATETLSKLQTEETILRASLYDPAGKLFARYPTNLAADNFPPAPRHDGYFFEKGTLKFIIGVREGDTRSGTLFLETDLDPMYRRLRLYAVIVGLVMIGSLFVALIVSNWLQKRISQPIVELAETAKAVSVRRDYLVRAQKYGNDELGLLTDAFNHMLKQIHERDLALRQGEARLRLALDASETGTWDWEIETGKLGWDNYLYRLYGLKAGDFDGRYETFMNYIHPEDRGRVSRQIKRALERGGEFISEFRVVWPDQTVHHLASRGKAFYDDSGKASRMSGVTLDITETREAAEALSLLAAIVESSDDAIIGKDLNGRIVSWNSGAERMFGYRADEMIGHEIEIIVPRNRLREETRMLERVRAGYTDHFETVRVRKDGRSLHVSLAVSPIRNSDGKILGVSSIARDITDRIQAEEEIRALNAQLEERVLQRTAELAATNKELEAFTYSVSHDLRAPLRHIDAYAQMLQEEMREPPETIQSYVARIRVGVQNMGKLVDDLLNLSRASRQEVSQEDCNLNAIVDEVLGDFKSEIDHRDIEWRIAELPSARCDAGLIKQVFTNLISNAIKYTRPREKAVIEIGVEKVDGQNAIFIRDNGVGFNMKYAHKLFGVFQRLHRAEDFEGTGVGLATVQRIIQLHQGRIWANAELDKGATFYFTLQGLEKPESPNT